jgi:hypothetical protein
MEIPSIGVSFSEDRLILPFKRESQSEGGSMSVSPFGGSFTYVFG